MPDDDSKLGTSDPNAADAPESTETSRAPESEGQGGLSADDTAKLNLSWKTTAEAERRRAEAAEAELATLRERQEPTPAAQGTDEGDEDEDALIRENLAIAKDPAARLSALNALNQRKLIREIGFKQQLTDACPDPEEREIVLQHFNENRHLYGNPRVAKQALDSKKLAADKAKLEAENERMKKALEQAKIQPPGGVPTHVRGNPETHKDVRQMSRAQWEKEQSELSDEDRMAQQRARIKKEIIVEPRSK